MLQPGAMVKSLAGMTAVIAVLAACNGSNGNTNTSNIDKGTPAAPTEGAPGSPSTDPTPPNDEPSGGGSPTPPTMAVSTETIDVAGTARAFVLAEPSTYSATRSYPLVLVLHGDGGDGEKMRSVVQFDAVSAQDAIVAYPSGTDGWNLYEPAATNPDLAFLITLVGALEKRFTIDPARVFGIGFSSGAFMLNQVGCRRPSLFRAIVPHSGGAPSEPRDPTATRWENGYTRCANQTLGSGPAVMVVHGTADADVSFESGDFTASYWAFINGCETTRSTPAATPPCLRQDACPPGKPVVFCPIADLGHAYWSSAAKVAWQFFGGL
jgi:polyhydroxybutyrate depolymerase